MSAHLSPEREALRAALVAALDEAHQTYPCPVTGRPYWTSCVHPDGSVGSCHSERRADAVLAVRDAELDAVRAERDRWRRQYRLVAGLTDDQELPEDGGPR